MSSFTQFEGEFHTVYCREASNILGDDYWLITKSFTYYVKSLESNIRVVVPAGFLTDGASVVRPFRMLIERMGRHSQAAALHDYMCERYQLEVNIDGHWYKTSIDRKEIDHIFYESLKVLGVGSVKRFLIRFGVDVFRIFRRPKRPKVNEVKTQLERSYGIDIKLGRTIN